MPKAPVSKSIDSNLGKGHADKNIFKCGVEDCTHSFQRKSDFIRHLRVHEPPELCPYADEGCEHTWRQRSNLQTHIRAVHLQVKDIECPTQNCDFTTADPATLTKHRKDKHKYKPNNVKLRNPVRAPRVKRPSRSNSSATSASSSNSNASTSSSQSPPALTREISPLPFSNIYPIELFPTTFPLRPVTEYSSSEEPERDESMIDPRLRAIGRARPRDHPVRDSRCLLQLPYPFERTAYAPATYWHQPPSPPQPSPQPSYNIASSSRLPPPPWRVQEESYRSFDAGRSWSS